MARTLERDIDGTALERLRVDLATCTAQADALGLSVIALYLQRALDEIDEMTGAGPLDGP